VVGYLGNGQVKVVRIERLALFVQKSGLF